MRRFSAIRASGSIKSSLVGAGLLLALALPVGASAADAKPRVYRLGYLGISTVGFDTDTNHCPVKGHPNWEAIVEGLREHGYVRGHNLVLECRWTEGVNERAPSLAAELVSLAPDLLLTGGGEQMRAARQATGTIPIVMTGVIDPVGRGMVASLARPGGNVTGLTDTLAEMEGKRLQFLKEIAPNVSRVAALYQLPGGRGLDKWMEYMEAPAKAVGMVLQFYGVKDIDEVAEAFAAMARAGEEAFYLVPLGYWEMGDHPKRIADLAAQYRMPSTFQARTPVEAGGLMAYHVDVPAIRRRVGAYVDKILKGANPGDLPVEQPTKFNLVINRRTATALGLGIPQSLMLMADEVID